MWGAKMTYHYSMRLLLLPLIRFRCPYWQKHSHAHETNRKIIYTVLPSTPLSATRFKFFFFLFCSSSGHGAPNKRKKEQKKNSFFLGQSEHTHKLTHYIKLFAVCRFTLHCGIRSIFGRFRTIPQIENELIYYTAQLKKCDSLLSIVCVSRFAVAAAASHQIDQNGLQTTINDSAFFFPMKYVFLAHTIKKTSIFQFTSSCCVFIRAMAAKILKRWSECVHWMAQTEWEFCRWAEFVSSCEQECVHTLIFKS